MTFCFLRRWSERSYVAACNRTYFCGDSAFRYTTGGCVERRKSARFLLRCPTIFEWTDQEGRSQVGAGFTRDIGTLGVFVLSNASPPDEGKLQMQIMLPPPQPAEEGLKLQSEVTVVRIESQSVGSGFAVKSEFALVGEAVGEPQISRKVSGRALSTPSRKANPSQLWVGSGGHQ